MKSSLFLSTTLFVALLCGSATTTQGATPWRFKHEDAGDLKLEDTSGPWLVMVASFSGQGADEQAKELAAELRQELGARTYVCRKKFAQEKELQGRGVDRFNNPLHMKYQRSEPGQDTEVAVMVGDYPVPDDKSAQKMLKSIKKFTPPSFAKHTEDSARTLATARQFFSEKSNRGKLGPLESAFLTPNPRLPQDYFSPKGPDKFVIEMNKGVKHNLLDSKARFSLKIATFTGATLIDQKLIAKAEEGKGKMGSKLAQAAENAHQLTEHLRAQGVEAYEFHDRYSSIVTVGSFDSVGSPRSDGKIEINPAIHQLIKKYGPEKDAVGNQTKPRKLAGITLDVNPTPVEVPRRSISADYTRTADLR